MGIIEENKKFAEDDRKYIWHPFTQMRDWEKEEPVIIEDGRGVFLKDVYGRWYIDGVSSMWANIHGHRNKEINEAISLQLNKIAHSTLLGLSNPPAIKLAEALVEITPEGLEKVFYSDNGSTAVEVALKMAFQYWQHKGEHNRTRFLSLNNAYHGDTIGAVSVGGVNTFHKVFSPLLFKTYKAPSPYCYRCELGLNKEDCALACLERMEEILKEHSDEIAAVIIEPLVQAAGGMIVSPDGYLSGVRELCNRYDVLLIADEVATGFGRTGKMFACEHEGISPDIMCVSKGITGGYLPLAATITTDKIYDTFLGEYKDLKTFFHGHTYTGNPLCCAAAIASLEIFKRHKTLESMQKNIKLLEERLRQMEGLPHVGGARNKGFMVGIELVRDKQTREPYPFEEKMGWKVANRAMAMGLFIRPLGNVVVLMPPISITDKELKSLLDIVEASIIIAVS